MTGKVVRRRGERLHPDSRGSGRRGDGPRTCLGGGCADTDAGSLRIDAAWRGVAVEFPGTREILRHRD